MRVLELSTNTVIEVDPGFGARLIEQGRAVLPPVQPKKAPKPVKKTEKADAKETEKE